MGFLAVRLRFDLEPDLPDDVLEPLLAATERYCVVYQTITRGVPVEIVRG